MNLVISSFLTLTAREAAAACVPICFRNVQPIEIDHKRGIINWAQLPSTEFDMSYVAWTWDDSGEKEQSCNISPAFTPSEKNKMDHDKCLNIAYKNNSLFFEESHFIDRTAKEFIINHYDDTLKKINILIIGHGIGALTKLQHETFPNAMIDTVDIDFATFVVADKWFCNGFDGIDSIRLIREDGIKYIKDLMTTSCGIEYDIMIFDVSEKAQWFRTKEVYLSVKRIWKLWSQNKARLMILNAFEYNPYDIAVEVFGKKSVEYGRPQPENHVMIIKSMNDKKEI